MALRGKLVLQIGAIALIGLLLGLLGWRLAARTEGANIAAEAQRGERPAAPFTLPTLAGDEEVTLSSFRGKPVVLNFWASWCLPCRDEAPAFRRRTKWGNQVVFIGVDAQDFVGDARKFVEKYGVTYTNVHDGSGSTSGDSASPASRRRSGSMPRAASSHSSRERPMRRRSSRTSKGRSNRHDRALRSGSPRGPRRARSRRSGRGERAEPTRAELENEVYCPTCNTLLALSSSPIAERMRSFIDARIAAGDTKTEIKDQLVDQFGEESSRRLRRRDSTCSPGCFRSPALRWPPWSSRPSFGAGGMRRVRAKPPPRVEPQRAPRTRSRARTASTRSSRASIVDRSKTDRLAVDAQIPLAFVAGLLSFVTPCVLPLVPGYLSAVSGAETGVAGRRVLVASLPFVAGFTTVFVVLGTLIAGAGGLVDDPRVVRQVAGIVIVVMGLAFMGLLPLPFLERLAAPSLLESAQGSGSRARRSVRRVRCAVRRSGARLDPPAPSNTSTVWSGAVLLAVYSLGLAVPFLLVGIGFGHVAARRAGCETTTRSCER